MRRALAVISLVVASGCPKDDEPPQFDPTTDRALIKLKAEQERLAKEKTAPPPPDPLADAIKAPIRPEDLGIPKGVEADLGPVTLTLLGVQQSQTAGNQKVSLTTPDRFLKVTLEARAREELEFDVSGAQLAQGDQTFGLARDVQRAAKGTPSLINLRPADPKKLELWFECPPDVVGKGLKIILSRGADKVELALQ